MSDEPLRKKIKRTKPNKKWESTEIHLLLDYLIEANEFEAPTARLFYKKFIERSGIDATWELLKWKVRHLKSNYHKALAWRNASARGILESDGSENIQDMTYKICPYFDRLEKVFAASNGKEPSPNCTTSSVEETLLEDTKSSVAELLYTKSSAATSSNVAETPSQSASSGIAEPSSEKHPRFALRKHITISNLLNGHNERANINKMQLEFERKKWTEQQILEEKKLNFEEKKFYAELKLKREELELKKFALEQADRLKRLEIEKDERIAIYEIELKYGTKE